MINAKQLGYRIKLEREKKHLTQEQLGATINYTKQQISNWERGISMPSADILQELSKHLNVNLLTELAHQGDNIMPELPDLESYNDPKAILATVNELVDSIPLAASNDAPVRYMLSTTLWVAIGLEYHLLRTTDKKKLEYWGWEHVADTLYSLAIDHYSLGDEPNVIVTSEEVDQWAEEYLSDCDDAIPARMKYKVKQILDFIYADQVSILVSAEASGTDLREQFDAFEYKMAEYTTFVAERLVAILPCKENELFSSYRIALYRLAEVIDEKSFYHKQQKEWEPFSPIELF